MRRFDAFCSNATFFTSDWNDAYSTYSVFIQERYFVCVQGDENTRELERIREGA